MNEVVPIGRQGAVAFSGKQLDLIRKTVAADCNPDEFNLYIEVANRIGLDPFRKQIYAVVYNKADKDKRKLSIITSIDGYRSVAARNRNYRPNDEATTFEQSDSLKSDSNPMGLIRAVTKCWQLGPEGQWHAVAGEAYWDEFVPLKDSSDEGWDWVDTGETWPDSGKPKKRKVPKNGAEVKRIPDGKWLTMPHIMLGKCAEAQALRKGWPEDLSGVYVAEEMDQARAADMSASDVVEAYERDKRLLLTTGRDSIFVQWNPTDPLEAVPIGRFADRAAEYAKRCETLPDLHGWKDTNRVALQDFWARSKADALELKKLLETREKELIEAARS